MIHRNLHEKIDVSQRYSKRLISGRVTATNGIRNPLNMKMVYGLGANRIEVLRALEKQNKLRIIWYSIFILLGVVALCVEPKSWFYFLNLVILMLNVDLVAQGKLIGIYLGILQCLMHVYICAVTHLWGEVIKMFVINIPLNIFAIVSWTKNLRAHKKEKYKADENEEITIKKVPYKSYWWILLLLAITYVLSFFGLKLLNTAALALSAAALTLTIFQKIFNALCYKESWWFSIANEIVGLAMWTQIIVTQFIGGNIDLIQIPQIIGSFACLIQGFYAYNMWKNMYRKIAVNGGEILAKRKVKINKIIKLRRTYQQLFWDREIDETKNS